MIESASFLPDWVSSPGETILDFLNEQGLSPDDLAQEIDTTIESTYRLLRGEQPINSDLAMKLTEIVGGSSEFWLTREEQFRAGLNRLKNNEEWANQFPVKEMADLGWVPTVKKPAQKIAACLRYFDVASVADWFQHYEGSHRPPAFRTSPTFSSDEGATLAWLRKGEIEASKITCEAWDQDQFFQALPQIRELTRKKRPEIFIPELKRICAKVGVALVIEPSPKGCRASGATRILSPEKANIMMSGRYLSDDHFWFTFFHEAGHLILHKEFIENCEQSEAKQETEANQFSFDILIPKTHQSEFLKLPVNTKAVMRFARKIGISPGIVVGQMQNHGHCPFNMLNRLKVRYKEEQLASESRSTHYLY